MDASKKRVFKKFYYRGVDLDQLLEMNTQQFSELVRARIRRRINRGLKRPQDTLLKKLRKAKKSITEIGEKPSVVKTHQRNMIILPEMVGSMVGVYNGKTYTQVEIKPEMIGHYLGEFSMTYKPVKHGRPGIGATHSSRFIPLKLRAVGQLTIDPCDNYEIGQWFIHRVFGYRAVVLKLWLGKLYEKDVAKDTVEKYYQVLIDNEDLMSCSLLKTGITFLPESKLENNISIIPDMDYVTQNDIVPFASNNSLVNRFRDLNFVSKETITQWISSKKSFLEITSIHREITESVRVTVIPFYLGEVTENKREMIKFWRYVVRIENMSNRNITLRKRILKILSLDGNLETIFGKGVDGLPIMLKVNSTLQYHSHVQLNSSPGHMWGAYVFEEVNGQIFIVKIPTFPLCCKYDTTANDVGKKV